MLLFGKKSKIVNAKNLFIGSNVYIGDDFYCVCEGKVIIKSGAIISNNCTIITYNHDYNDTKIFPYGLDNICKDVIINENVWIGININICPGVEIGKMSIIGMGTTITKNVPENVIFGGNRILSERKEKNKKYDLLAIRTIYNPINYIRFKYMFSHIVKKAKTTNQVKTSNIIDFDMVKLYYKNKDYLSMIYILSKEKKYKVEWENDIIEISN